MWVYTRADLARARQPAGARAPAPRRARRAARRAHEGRRWPRSACRRRSCCTRSPPGSSACRSRAASGTRRSWRRCSSPRRSSRAPALMILLALVVRRAGKVSLQGRPRRATSAGMLAVFVAVEALPRVLRDAHRRVPGGGLRGGPGAPAAHRPLRRLLLVRGGRRAGRPVRPARLCGACAPTCAGWPWRRRSPSSASSSTASTSSSTGSRTRRCRTRRASRSGRRSRSGTTSFALSYFYHPGRDRVPGRRRRDLLRRARVHARGGAAAAPGGRRGRAGRRVVSRRRLGDWRGTARADGRDAVGSRHETRADQARRLRGARDDRPGPRRRRPA